MHDLPGMVALTYKKLEVYEKTWPHNFVHFRFPFLPLLREVPLLENLRHLWKGGHPLILA